MKITRRLFALLALVAFAASVSAEDLPNIVVFLSDDHTLTDSSLYGSTDLKTPNMERIAKDGMTFDQAFVASPSCAPKCKYSSFHHKKYSLY